MTLALTLSLLAFRVDAEPSRSDSTSQVTLALTGDVYIDAPTRNTLRSLAQKVGAPRAHRELIAEVSPTLRSASIAIVNLETPVSPRYRERRPGEPPIFSAHDQLLDALRDAGVDALTLANNHAYDQGLRGLRETLSRAEELGIPTVGVSTDEDQAAGPLMLPTPLGRIGLCAWTQSLNLRPHDAPEEGEEATDFIHVSMLRDETLASCLGRARRTSSFTVAAVHLTPSGWRGPRSEERELVRRVAEAGADLVIAHGPHIPGPAERLRTGDDREVLVIYSMGNLIGAMGREMQLRRRPRASERDAPVLTLTLRRDDSPRLQIAGARLTPFWIADAAPRSPWWPTGQPLTRPLSIAGELQRANSADCGPRCEHHARIYRRRARLLASAISVADLSLEANATKIGADFSVDAAPSAEAPVERPSPEPVETPAEAAAAPPQPRETPAEAASAPPPPTETPADAQRLSPESGPSGAPTDLDPDQITIPTLRTGVILPLRFTHNRVPPEVTDEAAISRLADFLEEHRTLQIELEGTALPDEDLLETERFGARRARAAMWEIAGRGPSRSRFELSGSAETGTPRVILRVSP